MHLTHGRTPLCLALLGALASSCLYDGPTRGELRNAEFAWDDGVFGCLFGCDADDAMAARAQADLLVLNYEELPAFTVASDAAAVAEFFHGPDQTSYITVVSYAAGTATVTLSDTVTDETVDRLAIEVRDVGGIAVDAPDYRDTLTIQLGGDVTLLLDLTDDRGRTLKGVGAVDYAFGGGISETELTLVSAIEEVLIAIFTGSATEYVQLTANALGAGTIAVSAPSGAALTVPVAVVDETAAAGVALEATFDGTPVATEDSLPIYAAAFDATDEEIHSPECAWSIAPAGAIAFDAMGRDYASVAATAPGTATVTCVIGTATASIDVTFE